MPLIPTPFPEKSLKYEYAYKQQVRALAASRFSEEQLGEVLKFRLSGLDFFEHRDLILNGIKKKHPLSARISGADISINQLNYNGPNTASIEDIEAIVSTNGLSEFYERFNAANPQARQAPFVFYQYAFVRELRLLKIQTSLLEREANRAFLENNYETVPPKIEEFVYSKVAEFKAIMDGELDGSGRVVTQGIFDYPRKRCIEQILAVRGGKLNPALTDPCVRLFASKIEGVRVGGAISSDQLLGYESIDAAAKEIADNRSKIRIQGTVARGALAEIFMKTGGGKTYMSEKVKQNYVKEGGLFNGVLNFSLNSTEAELKMLQGEESLEGKIVQLDEAYFYGRYSFLCEGKSDQTAVEEARNDLIEKLIKRGALVVTLGASESLAKIKVDLRELDVQILEEEKRLKSEDKEARKDVIDNGKKAIEDFKASSGYASYKSDKTIKSKYKEALEILREIKKCESKGDEEGKKEAARKFLKFSNKMLKQNLGESRLVDFRKNLKIQDDPRKRPFSIDTSKLNSYIDESERRLAERVTITEFGESHWKTHKAREVPLLKQRARDFLPYIKILVNSRHDITEDLRQNIETIERLLVTDKNGELAELYKAFFSIVTHPDIMYDFNSNDIESTKLVDLKAKRTSRMAQYNELVVRREGGKVNGREVRGKTQERFDIADKIVDQSDFGAADKLCDLVEKYLDKISDRNSEGVKGRMQYVMPHFKITEANCSTEVLEQIRVETEADIIIVPQREGDDQLRCRVYCQQDGIFGDVEMNLGESRAKIERELAKLEENRSGLSGGAALENLELDIAGLRQTLARMPFDDSERYLCDLLDGLGEGIKDKKILSFFDYTNSIGGDYGAAGIGVTQQYIHVNDPRTLTWNELMQANRDRTPTVNDDADGVKRKFIYHLDLTASELEAIISQNTIDDDDAHACGYIRSKGKSLRDRGQTNQAEILRGYEENKVWNEDPLLERAREEELKLCNTDEVRSIEIYEKDSKDLFDLIIELEGYDIDGESVRFESLWETAHKDQPPTLPGSPSRISMGKDIISDNYSTRIKERGGFAEYHVCLSSVKYRIIFEISVNGDSSKIVAKFFIDIHQYSLNRGSLDKVLPLLQGIKNSADEKISQKLADLKKSLKEALSSKDVKKETGRNLNKIGIKDDEPEESIRGNSDQDIIIYNFDTDKRTSKKKIIFEKDKVTCEYFSQNVVRQNAVRPDSSGQRIEIYDKIDKIGERARVINKGSKIVDQFLDSAKRTNAEQLKTTLETLLKIDRPHFDNNFSITKPTISSDSLEISYIVNDEKLVFVNNNVLVENKGKRNFPELRFLQDKVYEAKAELFRFRMSDFEKDIKEILDGGDLDSSPVKYTLDKSTLDKSTLDKSKNPTHIVFSKVGDTELHFDLFANKLRLQSVSIANSVIKVTKAIDGKNVETTIDENNDFRDLQWLPKLIQSEREELSTKITDNFADIVKDEEKPQSWEVDEISGGGYLAKEQDKELRYLKALPTSPQSKVYAVSFSQETNEPLSSRISDLKKALKIQGEIKDQIEGQKSNKKNELIKSVKKLRDVFNDVFPSESDSKIVGFKRYKTKKATLLYAFENDSYEFKTDESIYRGEIKYDDESKAKFNDQSKTPLKKEEIDSLEQKYRSIVDSHKKTMSAKEALLRISQDIFAPDSATKEQSFDDNTIAEVSGILLLKNKQNESLCVVEANGLLMIKEDISAEELLSKLSKIEQDIAERKIAKSQELLGSTLDTIFVNEDSIFYEGITLRRVFDGEGKAVLDVLLDEETNTKNSYSLPDPLKAAQYQGAEVKTHQLQSLEGLLEGVKQQLEEENTRRQKLASRMRSARVINRPDTTKSEVYAELSRLAMNSDKGFATVQFVVGLAEKNSDLTQELDKAKTQEAKYRVAKAYIANNPLLGADLEKFIESEGISTQDHQKRTYALIESEFAEMDKSSEQRSPSPTLTARMHNLFKTESVQALKSNGDTGSGGSKGGGQRYK